MSEKPGKVYLIGAGPGAPKLLTLRGWECLQKVDVVLYDALVNPAILSLANPQAKQICVGKHGTGPLWSQSDIDDQVVHFSRLGLRVARLKGGDTSIFARTAEELDRLVRENIPFEVVPGITSAQTACSHAGIPITHRDWASAVAFITPQMQAVDGGEEAEETLNWESLAHFPGTLVFYMGVTTAPRWSHRLLAAGKAPDTPVAIVRKCSLPDQQLIQCQLHEVAHRLKEPTPIRPPVLIIVGEVANLGEQYDWFTRRPMFGQTVLITRPVDSCASWVSVLEELGAEVVAQPMIEIVPQSLQSARESWLSRWHAYDWILFSSQHGVQCFFDLLWEHGADLRFLGSARVGAVGPSTAQALHQRRIRCDLVPPSQFGAESLARLLEPQAKGQRFLLVQGNQTQPLLKERLQASGGEFDVATVYENRDVATVAPTVRKRLLDGGIDYVTVSSGSIARVLVSHFGEALRRTKLISLSKSISQELERLGHEAHAELVDLDMQDPRAWLALASRSNR